MNMRNDLIRERGGKIAEQKVEGRKSLVCPLLEYFCSFDLVGSEIATTREEKRN